MATPVTLESKIECDGEDVVQTDTEDVTASQIADMAEHVALAVLRDRLAEMAAQAPEDRRCVGNRTAFHGDAADQDEAATG